uniref:Uncharacterized protein n=1 Tax=Romanomermis culicivorax TaxID=13658 RepID=A0A915HS29_ROMCU
MPTTHRHSDEYILDLDLPDWCAMSPPPKPEAAKVEKSPPTIPADYKIQRKQENNSDNFFANFCHYEGITREQNSCKMIIEITPNC